MKRRFLVFSLCILLLSGLWLLPCGATSAFDLDTQVFDRGNLFTESERREINEAAQQASQSTGCLFYVITHVSSYNDLVYVGNDFLYENGLSYSTGAVLLIITLDHGRYYYDMYTYGDAFDRISDKEVNYILDYDDVFDNLKGGSLKEGACAFLKLSAKAYKGRVGVSYLLIGGISLAISLVIGVVACVSVKSAYSMKKKSVDYPLQKFAKLELTHQKDVFTGSFITKRIIESSSGGHGGGGGGRGGGGGHRGGR